ncbi:MAG: Crp/Fnr family transcriptional regulator [Zetaproteobacteria bacterium]|nr:Crp/Fnr family transcriptional regulator [Zetaproteobacteria bacterium]
MKTLFKSIYLFSELDDTELDAIAALATTHHFAKHNMIVQEGERGEALYIILEGSVKISTYSCDGREVILSLLEPGAFFGEMSLLDRQPRSANATSLESTTVVQIRRKNFEHLLLQTPRLTIKLLTEVVSRLRRTSLILERISTMDVPHRLYSYLQDFCERFGELKNNQMLVRLPTHQLIADQLSTSRETISRAISSLKKEKIICPTPNSRHVCIDMDAIETLLLAMQ